MFFPGGKISKTANGYKKIFLIKYDNWIKLLRNNYAKKSLPAKKDQTRSQTRF